MTKEEYKLSLGTCHFYCNYDSVTDAQWAVWAEGGRRVSRGAWSSGRALGSLPKPCFPVSVFYSM